MLRKTIAFILVMLALSMSVSAQKVGVVMSGGGAKGLYHIGVLEALEQNGIPIDYVSGTSMGAIIAGMYAAGYSPAEMHELAVSGHLKEWVAGRIDQSYTPYYRQVNRMPAAFTLRLNTGEGAGRRNRLAIPTNLISSTQIDMALTGLFAPASVACGGDFSKLMVPFMCVASDMNSRRGVLLESGDLGQTVRASMAIPIIFPPVARDSMLLYDGGMYNNFPWKPLDEKYNPDLLIGIKCTSGNTQVAKENNLIDQVFALTMNQTDYSMPQQRSVMIDHAIDVNTLDFDKAQSIIQTGYDDAMAKMDSIKAKVRDTVSADYYARRREAFRSKCRPLVFDNYKFEGLKPAQETYVRDFSNMNTHYTKKQRREIPFEQFRSNLYSILTDGDFLTEYPKISYNPVTEHYGIDIKLATKPNLKLMIGGNISSTAFNQAYIGVSYQIIGRVAQKFYGDLYLGPVYSRGAFGGRTDLYMWKPLFIDYSFNFMVKNLRHGNFGNITPVDNTEQIKNSDSFLSVGVGFPLTHRSLVSLRLNGGNTNFHYRYSELDVGEYDHTRFTFVGAKLEIERNTLDKLLYPRKGSHLRLSGIFIYGKDKYFPSSSHYYVESNRRHWFGARLQWDKYFAIPSCDWFSFGINVDALYSNQPSMNNEPATLIALPAFKPVANANMMYMPEFSARRFVAGGVVPTFQIFPNFLLRTGFYMMYRERHKLFDGSGEYVYSDVTRHYIADVAFVYHTPIGPASLSLTKYGLENYKNMYMMFNFGFTLFSHRALFY